ncbi:hypothetical protein PF005_g17204 [Phytophthora fragariae]|uniref:RxLR effector protein n=1 Tax=Phytophthora fragariae TaxID=53985 RepID=A0A6A3X2Y5_9STRA|nr:hypothetical protein PF005_g17204 [Phytophthora fragariae]
MNLTKIIAHLAIIATTMGVLAEAGNVNQQAPRTGVSNEDAFVGPRSHANTPIVTPVPTPVPTAATPPPTPYAIPAPASNSATANAPQLPTKPSDKDNNNAKIGNNTPGSGHDNTIGSVNNDKPVSANKAASSKEERDTSGANAGAGVGGHVGRAAIGGHSSGVATGGHVGGAAAGGHVGGAVAGGHVTGMTR